MPEFVSGGARLAYKHCGLHLPARQAPKSMNEPSLRQSWTRQTPPEQSELQELPKL
jgi:hypothetical protein